MDFGRSPFFPHVLHVWGRARGVIIRKCAGHLSSDASRRASSVFGMRGQRNCLLPLLLVIKILASHLHARRDEGDEEEIFHPF